MVNLFSCDNLINYDKLKLTDIEANLIPFPYFPQISIPAFQLYSYNVANIYK